MRGQRHRSVQRQCVAAIGTLLVVIASRSARAQNVTLQAAGGTGGDPYTMTCGSNALVGIQGQGGINPLAQPVIFYLSPWCVELNADGTWNGDPTNSINATVGTRMGPDFQIVDMKCPRNMAVSGVKGHAGSYVSELEIVCSSLGTGGKTSGSARAADASAGVTQIVGAGISLDGAFGTFLCPNSYPGKAFTGRAHSWIDQLALVCGLPTVKPPVAAAIDVPGTWIRGGSTASGIVTLNGPAPQGGTSITLETLSGLTMSPNPVIVPSGQKTAAFVVTAAATALPIQARIYPSPSATSALSAFVEILPPTLVGLSLASNYVTSGNSTTGTVRMAGKAFSGGLAALLSTGDASVATVPSTVTVAEGDTLATFPVTLAGGATGCTYVRAEYGGNHVDAYVAVAPPPSFARNNKFPIGLSGKAGSAQVTISYPFTSANTRTVTMTSTNSALVAVPSTVTVPANAQSATVGLTITNGTGASSCVTVTAHDATGSSNSVILMLQGSSVVAVAG